MMMPEARSGNVWGNLTRFEWQLGLVFKDNIEGAVGPGCRRITTDSGKLICSFIPRISFVSIDMNKLSLQ
jgi:hypothetical protein